MSQTSEEVGPGQEWRSLLLQRLLVATTPIVAAAVAMSVWTSQGRNRVALSLLLPMVPLQLVAVYARSWSFNLRAWILIGPVLFASFVAYGLVGFTGNGSVVAASAIVFSALLFDRRCSRPVNMPKWAMAGLAVTFVVQRVEASLTKTKRALEDLRAEQRRREEAERERQLAQEAALQTQKMELVGRLAAGVAHDFNNVLGVVGSWAELLLLELPENPERQEAREAVDSAMQQGRALTRRLLTLARRDERAPTRLQLHHAVSNSVSTLRRVMPGGVALSFTQLAEANVHADETELQQVVFNLVLNARDAIGERGTIRVTANVVERTEAIDVVGGALAAGRWAALQVKDSGPGIDPAIRERIFEQFFTTKPVGTGTGLGLATVVRIAQISGGGVALETPPEGGACFSVYLPCVD